MRRTESVEIYETGQPHLSRGIARVLHKYDANLAENEVGNPVYLRAELGLMLLLSHLRSGKSPPNPAQTAPYL